MYYAMRASAPSLHRESTDSLIRNQEPIPRTLFRNGKRSKNYLSQTTSTDVQPEIEPTASNVSHHMHVPSTINTVYSIQIMISHTLR